MIVELVTEARAVLFTFDQSDVAPLTLDDQAFEEHARVSSVYHAAFAYLCAITRLPAELDPTDAHALRELTREVARSLVRTFSTADASNTTLHARAHRVLEQMHDSFYAGKSSIDLPA